MNLPHPTPKSVERFRVLMREEYQIELTDKESEEWATRALQLFYLTTYALPPLNLDGEDKKQVPLKLSS